MPNSPNVIMAAQHAAQLSDKEVLVAPTTSQQAGLVAALALAPTRSVEENAGAIAQALSRMRTGAVAPAARDDAQGRFKRGEAVGFVQDEVLVWGDAEHTLRAVLGRAVARRSEDGLVAGADQRAGRRGGAAGARGSSSRWSTAGSSSSCVTGASRPTGGCSPPSRPCRLTPPAGSSSAGRCTRPPDSAPARAREARPRAGSRPRVRVGRAARPRAPARGARALAAAVAAARPRCGCRASGWRPEPGRSGWTPSGTSSSTCPSDSRESRTLAELRAGEPATVEVVVRSISARPVRRRGMRPAGRGAGRRRRRLGAGALLQPAVARRSLPAGHEAAAARQGRRPRRLRRLPPRPRRRAPPPAAARRAAAATDGGPTGARRPRPSPTTPPPRGSARPRS